MLTAAESKCGSNPDQISSVAEKTDRCREVIEWHLIFGHALLAVAFVERWVKEE